MLVDETTNELAAFLDISELTHINVRIFDLCYFMGHLPKDEEETNKWFLVFENLLAGYQTISAFSDAEFEAIPYMCVFIQLLWIAFGAMCGWSSDYSPNNGFWTYDNRSRLLFADRI